MNNSSINPFQSLPPATLQQNQQENFERQAQEVITAFDAKLRKVDDDLNKIWDQTLSNPVVLRIYAEIIRPILSRMKLTRTDTQPHPAVQSSLPPVDTTQSSPLWTDKKLQAWHKMWQEVTQQEASNAAASAPSSSSASAPPPISCRHLTFKEKQVSSSKLERIIMTALFQNKEVTNKQIRQAVKRSGLHQSDSTIDQRIYRIRAFICREARFVPTERHPN